VDVVRGGQGADVPLRFIVVRREKLDFNDDVALDCFCPTLELARAIG
jgi:hypothetical protein